VSRAVFEVDTMTNQTRRAIDRVMTALETLLAVSIAAVPAAWFAWLVFAS